MAPKRICVAEITGAHGLAGEVKLKSFTTDAQAVKTYSPLESEDGAARFILEYLRPAKGHVIARFPGVDDRDSAEQLRGTRLFVGRERMPEPAADEFYHVDLIGLRAVTTSGEEIGTVTAVHDFGAGAILELKSDKEEFARPSMMVPFTAAFTPQIDIPGGRIVVAPPADDAPTRPAPLRTRGSRRAKD